jgi:hypothetical protein
MIVLVGLFCPTQSFGRLPHRPLAVTQMNPHGGVNWREEAIAYAGGGQQARKLIDSRGDNAAKAVLSCSPGVARKLAAFHHAGMLNQLPRADELLNVIGEPFGGDDVCEFIFANAQMLRDVDACDAFLMSPFEYIVSPNSLADGAAEVHALRLRQSSRTTRVILIASVAGLVALLIWRRRAADLT